ncbi:MAG: DNA-processing protein DprA [bacterium]|nr:DNA-processing protein DprA [bacterium]
MSRTNLTYQEDLSYWVGLSLFPKFGPARQKKLLAYFSDAKSAYEAQKRELISAGLDEKTAAEFIQSRSGYDLDSEMEKIKKQEIGVITYADLEYPRLLSELPDAPALLYYRGNLKCAQRFCLAVVGSRKFSSYGEHATMKLVGELARCGLSIVSGLAIGIDTLAHNAALQANGKTIAVLGSGVDKLSVYPRANFNLSEKIIDNGGLLISEFPLGTPALRHHFPQRNRIVAGLSLGALIIEAAAKSGALITAGLALDYNREVFAVPGNIFSAVSAGTNELIKNGAQLVASAQDVLSALSLENANASQKAQKNIPDTALESDLMSILNHEPMHINTLARTAKLDTATINATLITMELKGYIRNVGGGNYILS